jgi:hypothetical protein
MEISDVTRGFGRKDAGGALGNLVVGGHSGQGRIFLGHLLWDGRLKTELTDITRFLGRGDGHHDSFLRGEQPCAGALVLSGFLDWAFRMVEKKGKIN